MKTQTAQAEGPAGGVGLLGRRWQGMHGPHQDPTRLGEPARCPADAPQSESAVRPVTSQFRNRKDSDVREHSVSTQGPRRPPPPGLPAPSGETWSRLAKLEITVRPRSTVWWRQQGQF